MSKTEEIYYISLDSVCVPAEANKCSFPNCKQKCSAECFQILDSAITT